MRRIRIGVGSAAAALALALLTASCTVPYVNRCGEARRGGGPTVYRTRGQELCELARRAVHVNMTPFADAGRMEIERVYAVVERLRRAESVEDLVARLREAAGDPMADKVAAAVAWAREGSDKPWGEGGERCLVEGAAKGVRLAFEERFVYLGRDDGLTD